MQIDPRNLGHRRYPEKRNQKAVPGLQWAASDSYACPLRSPVGSRHARACSPIGEVENGEMENGTHLFSEPPFSQSTNWEVVDWGNRKYKFSS